MLPQDPFIINAPGLDVLEGLISDTMDAIAQGGLDDATEEESDQELDEDDVDYGDDEDVESLAELNENLAHAANQYNSPLTIPHSSSPLSSSLNSSISSASKQNFKISDKWGGSDERRQFSDLDDDDDDGYDKTMKIDNSSMMKHRQNYQFETENTRLNSRPGDINHVDHESSDSDFGQDRNYIVVKRNMQDLTIQPPKSNNLYENSNSFSFSNDYNDEDDVEDSYYKTLKSNAGPGGGSAEKPVGLVHFACSKKGASTPSDMDKRLDTNALQLKMEEEIRAVKAKYHKKKIPLIAEIRKRENN